MSERNRPGDIFKDIDNLDKRLEALERLLSGISLLRMGSVSSEPAVPTSGGILYVYNGALKYVGSSGTRTTIANA